MSSTIEKYISDIASVYSSGLATEHSYRPALLNLFQEETRLEVINESKRSEFGAPDFIIKSKNIIFSHVEAKDVNEKLDEIEKGEQMTRYYGYSSIILTNSLEFRFYKNGQKYCEPIKIAEIKSGKIIGIGESFNLFDKTIKDFIKDSTEPIKSGVVLAKIMAGKAIRIRDNIKAYLSSGDKEKNKDLLSVFETLKKLLLSDLDLNKFADMYAQTVVYGLFVARYNDETPANFTRQEARDLVPPSNPFLRHFFDHVAGPSFDKRIEWIVNELCEEFNHADVKAIVHNYYHLEKDDSRDPIVHFYEDFLKEYDAKERMSMGVFYTPLPVVRFIVRSIDEILKKDFGLEKGLADSSKVEIQRTKSGKKGKEFVHKVQLLDPATGTGTFLNEVINQIHMTFTGQEGRWKSYVKEDLLPRINGFELMIASYTIAHLKLSTTLKESGADMGDERIRVFLTNSLEKDEIPAETLFGDLGLGQAITEESREANRVKNDLPIMVVLGNPPYSGESNNKFENANRLIDKYKFEPGGVQKLQERNPKWLNDDYVKFMAFAEDLIIKNGEGILGYITNHSYLDNPTFRGMRWKLTQTFDEIYIVDLHGNAKLKEKHPDGSKDENIFAIQQGVSIILGIKIKNKKIKKDARVFVSDIFGKKELKFDLLNKNKIKYTEIKLDPKQYYFVNKNIEGKEDYEKGFSVSEIFKIYSAGVITGDDEKFVKYSNIDFEKDTEQENIYKYLWRPCDFRYINYDVKKIGRSRQKVMVHMKNSNISFVFSRADKSKTPFSNIFVTKYISDGHSLPGLSYAAPLFLYNEDGSKISNFKKEIIDELEKVVGKTTPENILDYIYAILHSPGYRGKYTEFLKIDFPRIRYPKDKKQFNELIKLGEELRRLHLLESNILSKSITTYNVSGDDTVEKISYKDKKVFINKTQYFGNVPEIVWNFYIGGYQPAQKWLKDRKGRKLLSSDIEHYQKIIMVLVETDRIMKEIDLIK